MCVCMCIRIEQVGCGTPKAWVTLIGCLAGGLVYSLLDNIIAPMWSQVCEAPHISLSMVLSCGVKSSTNIKLIVCGCGQIGVTMKPYVDQLLNTRIQYLSLPGGGMMIAFAILIEVLVPWTREVPEHAENRDDCSAFACASWPPEVHSRIINKPNSTVHILTSHICSLLSLAGTTHRSLGRSSEPSSFQRCLSCTSCWEEAEAM